MLLSTPPFQHVPFEDKDLLDSSFYALNDAHALWAHLRDTQPAYRCDPGDGREAFWVITRYNDVDRILRDYESFSSRRGTMLCIVDLSMPDIASDEMMPDTDPPRHRQLREPLNRALTPRVVARQESAIRTLARDLLRPAIEKNEFDIVQAALMFPMSFTGLLMGIRPEKWKRMSELTTMTIAYDDPDYSLGDPVMTLRQAHHELFASFQDEVSRRPQDDERDDLISILQRMDLDENPLSERQIMLNCYALLLGANVTTPHVICTMVQMMGQHPDQFDRLRQDPQLRRNAVQEILRWSSPASHFMRYSTRDVDIHGCTIRAGEPVSVWLGSANRDERAFPDPYKFDITRRPNRHLAFGVGPHYCIGSGLATFALGIFLDELLESVQHCEQVAPAQHLHSNFVAGFKHMPIRFTPRK